MKLKTASSITLATAPRVTSRRRPCLRLVGQEPPPAPRHVRHLNEHITHSGVTSYRVLEVWTFEEYDNLSPEERPAFQWLLPGLGWLTAYDVEKNEADDIEDMALQHRQMLGW